MGQGFLPLSLLPLASPVVDNVFTFWSVDGATKPDYRHFRGRLFSDGSCFKGLVPGADRAGLGCIELGEDGALLFAIAGPVWGDLPQTSGR